MCRHVVGSPATYLYSLNLTEVTQSICRYFGEPIDEENVVITKKYCQKMCDVRQVTIIINIWSVVHM